MSTIELAVETHSQEATARLGRLLGAGLEPGDWLFLEGDLGGGKTTFSRGLVSGLGHTDPREVCSPTFAIHQRYEGGRLPVNHLDLYRLAGGEQLRVQGILDPLWDQDAVSVVEWSERLADLNLQPQVVILFEFLDEHRRRLVFSFQGPRAHQLADLLSGKS